MNGGPMLAKSNYDVVDLTNQTFWWYGKETGLYYDNPNLVGLGRTFSEIEDISDGKVGYPAGQPRLEGERNV
jgi:hypothetical protein